MKVGEPVAGSAGPAVGGAATGGAVAVVVVGAAVVVVGAAVVVIEYTRTCPAKGAVPPFQAAPIPSLAPSDDNDTDRPE